MKKWISLILPTLMWGQTYNEVIESLNTSLSVQSAQQIQKAAYENSKITEGKNYPSIDATLSFIRFKETPSVTFYSPTPQTAPMGTKNHTEGAITITYPLFSGFAIGAANEKATIEYEKAGLALSDLKRNLYLNATQLYGNIISQDSMIQAHTEAKKAMEDAYAKAKGFYDHGLLAPAELYAIEAKQHSVEAQLSQAKNRKKQALNQLSYLTHSDIKDATPFTDTLAIPEHNDLVTIALIKREDLKALAKGLDLALGDITLAKSQYYPNIALVGAVKHQGNTLELNGDGYSNANKSYAGATASWNLFNGLSDSHAVQAAQAQKLSAQLTYEDYKNKVTMEIDNAYEELNTLESMLHSAQMEVKAAQEYTNLTRGRFDNKLASADELSRAIADLSSIKAKEAILKSDLFTQKATLWLLGGLKVYEEKVLKKN
ncbi:MAG: TolC family protein [Epsilonproteobacteria bacterium]|nr:TolC family protein [Campylobacterota bacterium]